MWGRRLATIALALSLAPAAWAVSTSIPPANQPLSGPSSALERLADAYRSRSVAGIDAVLTGDYIFHGMTDSLGKFTIGSTRSEEMSVVRGMLQGVTRNGRVIMPRADSVGMSIDGISAGVDPEHPDSTQQFQVLTVTRAQMGIRLANGKHFMLRPSLHVFHVVRGDAAVLAPGQKPDPDRWYIRRWLEDVTSLRAALNAQHGDCGEPEPTPDASTGAAPAGSLAVPVALGVHALTNPACSALRISCDLPGSEPAHVDVYDVSGRLVNTRALEVKAAGNVTVDAGAGAHLLPGVYWVRLGQAARRPSTRMVVVAH